MVHIRQYDDRDYPTRTGISFTKGRWAMFLNCLEEMEKSVETMRFEQSVEYSKHLGGRYYVSIGKKFKCVSLRRFFLPHNSTKELPTRSGIALRMNEWNGLLDKIPLLQDAVPELKTAKPCFHSEDYANQTGRVERNPFELELDNRTKFQEL